MLSTFPERETQNTQGSGMSDWQSLYNWLNLHASAVPLFIFAVATLDALAVAGIIVPGIALMFGLTLIAGRDDLSFSLVMAFGMAGAMFGDGISFWLGKHFQKRMELMWPFRNHPQWLEQGEAFFERHGGKSIIIGRFIGPLRTFVPLCAGILNMPAWRFIGMNFLSALAWAPIHIFPGYLIGSAFDDPLMPGKDQLWFLLGLMISIAIVIKTILFLHRLFLPILSRCGNWIPDYHLLLRRTPGYDQLGPLPLAFLALLLFYMIGLHIGSPSLTYLDQRVLYSLDSLKQPFLDYLFVALSVLSYHKPMLTFTGLLIFYWIGRGAYGTALMGAINGLLALWILPWIIQQFGPFCACTAFDYPSPQSLTTVMIWGFIGIVMARALGPSQHARPLAFVTTLIMLTLCSSLYLHHHPFSAALGGLLLGIGLLAILRYFYYRFCSQTLTAREMSIVVLAALSLITVALVLPEMNEAVQHYAPLQPSLAEHRAIQSQRRARHHHVHNGASRNAALPAEHRHQPVVEKSGHDVPPVSLPADSHPPESSTMSTSHSSPAIASQSEPLAGDTNNLPPSSSQPLSAH